MPKSIFKTDEDLNAYLINWIADQSVAYGLTMIYHSHEETRAGILLAVFPIAPYKEGYESAEKMETLIPWEDIQEDITKAVFA